MVINYSVVIELAGVGLTDIMISLAVKVIVPRAVYEEVDVTRTW